MTYKGPPEQQFGGRRQLAWIRRAHHSELGGLRGRCAWVEQMDTRETYLDIRERCCRKGSPWGKPGRDC